MYIQWNLSIADMLYSGHLYIADTFSRNQLSQTTVKHFYFEPLYSGHLSIADTFSENQWCPLLRGFTVVIRAIYLQFILWEKVLGDCSFKVLLSFSWALAIGIYSAPTCPWMSWLFLCWKVLENTKNGLHFFPRLIRIQQTVLSSGYISYQYFNR